MAMAVLRVMENVHEEPVVCVSYDRVRKEIYSVAEGDRIIKARNIWRDMTASLASLINMPSLCKHKPYPLQLYHAWCGADTNF